MCVLALTCVVVGTWGLLIMTQSGSTTQTSDSDTSLEPINKLAAISRAKMTKSTFLPASISRVVAERNGSFKDSDLGGPAPRCQLALSIYTSKRRA